jgi:crotonobetainyl-CoA:carnitine CoA-transferase CaiB-like acyl-CoA transferase
LKQAAPLVTPPFRLSRTPASIRHRAPLLDEHAGELLPKARARGAAKAKT